MPRYFFHLVAAREHTKDELGCEFPDVEQAYLQAHRAALDMSIEMLREHADPSHYRFEITDASGNLLFDLPFSEVMRPRARHAPACMIPALKQQLDRRAKVLSELRNTFDKTRSLLEETKALLVRAARSGPA